MWYVAHLPSYCIYLKQHEYHTVAIKTFVDVHTHCWITRGSFYQEVELPDLISSYARPRCIAYSEYSRSLHYKTISKTGTGRGRVGGRSLQKLPVTLAQSPMPPSRTLTAPGWSLPRSSGVLLYGEGRCVSLGGAPLRTDRVVDQACVYSRRNKTVTIPRRRVHIQAVEDKGQYGQFRDTTYREVAPWLITEYVLTKRIYMCLPPLTESSFSLESEQQNAPTSPIFLQRESACTCFCHRRARPSPCDHSKQRPSWGKKHNVGGPSAKIQHVESVSILAIY